MRTVYKYSFGDYGDYGARNPLATFSMPLAAIPYRVGLQNGNICLWAEVNTDEITLQRSFLIIGTGHVIPDDWRYIGSCDDGFFVWHVGELK